jgi:hypothetical protein
VTAQGQVVAPDAVLEPVGAGRFEDGKVLAALVGRRFGASIASGIGARTATVGGSRTSAVMPPYQECRSCTLML